MILVPYNFPRLNVEGRMLTFKCQKDKIKTKKIFFEKTVHGFIFAYCLVINFVRFTYKKET